jgi:hypothetical protein
MSQSQVIVASSFFIGSCLLSCMTRCAQLDLFFHLWLNIRVVYILDN